MSDLETLHDVMSEILKNAKKKFVCPLCLISYSRADAAFGHCRTKGEEKEKMSDQKIVRCKIHSGIGCVNTGGDIHNFRQSLATACGRREITIEELELDLRPSHRPAYGSCLKRDYILKMMTSEIEARIDILRIILAKAGIHYVCPCCWSGFATSDSVLEHCGKESDANHQGLLSKDVTPFAELYGRLMEQNIDYADLDIDYDGRGVPNFHRCFELDIVLRHKSKWELYLTARKLRP